MSYTLAFWSGGDSADCGDIYNRLNGGEFVEGVAPVDEAVVEDRLATLDGWVRHENMLYPPGATTADGPAFDTFIDKQFVVFTGYGVEPHDINVVIDVMRGLDFRLSAPQTLERFE
ncbi:hypothetical protein [Gordonia neofelifaecis]|uniref:Uncharacterized protein n=1 Tax=Gordonia neofelifaecis NRRL B-59395 TaxID=644548 RepID=F1YED9_9ACTN|nr:hypothetical protein [Gordonia neofelifaecis]EGD56772.1 hypothetical protein SCNU_00300 [Gordonia neofelifaecis NRRL B-59395]